jgi:hypothetical protein
VDFDDKGKRSCAARLEEASQQWLVLVTEILDVFDVKIKSLWSIGCHYFLLTRFALN